MHLICSRKNHFCLVYCILFLLCGFLYGSASADSIKKRAIQVTADEEKRSVIQSVDGYAYLSENMTLSQTRAAAFATAKRQALEMAKTHIVSKSKVEDFELKYDLVISDAEGAVTILEQKDHGIVENTRYHVWIKAEVEYDLKPKRTHSNGNKPSRYDLNENLPLKVQVWTPKKNYRQGESIEIFLQGNRDFYARIVDISATGDIIQLLPNGFRKSNFFRKGKIYKVPGKMDVFNLTVTPPYGQEQVVVYASEVPLGEVSLNAIGSGLHSYSGTRKDLSKKSRGISVVGNKNAPQQGAEFYEGTWKLTTSN